MLALSTSNHPRASKSPTACTTLVHGKYATYTLQVFYVCLKLHVRNEVMYVRTYVWIYVCMQASRYVRTNQRHVIVSIPSQNIGRIYFCSHPAVYVCVCTYVRIYVCRHAYMYAYMLCTFSDSYIRHSTRSWGSSINYVPSQIIFLINL